MNKNQIKLLVKIKYCTLAVIEYRRLERATRRRLDIGGRNVLEILTRGQQGSQGKLGWKLTVYECSWNLRAWTLIFALLSS